MSQSEISSPERRRGEDERMRQRQRESELNQGRRKRAQEPEPAERLLNASNELYLYEVECEALGRPAPASVRRAHRTIRAELRRLSGRASAETHSAETHEMLDD